MKNFLLKYKWRIAGTIVGGLAGFLYWFYIGCNSGTCPIQSSWHISSLYGGLMGYLLSNIRKKKVKTDANSEKI